MGLFIKKNNQLVPVGISAEVVDGTDVSDTTAVAADVASGKYFYTADGTKTQGTYEGSGGSSVPSLTSTLPQYFLNISTLIDASYNYVNMYATPPVGDTIQMYTEGRWELSSLYEKDTGTPVPYTTISTSSSGSHYSFVMPNADVIFDFYYND